VTNTPPDDDRSGTTPSVGDQFDGQQTDGTLAEPTEGAHGEPNLPEDAQMMRRAAQRYGTVGAMLAGGMVVFDRLLGRKPKEEPAVVIEASTEPEDIEKGISLTLEQPDGEVLEVFAPPPGRRRSRAKRRRRVIE